MLGRIIEIEGEGRRLSLERGFLTISCPEGDLGSGRFLGFEEIANHLLFARRYRNALVGIPG